MCWLWFGASMLGKVRKWVVISSPWESVLQGTNPTWLVTLVWSISCSAFIEWTLLLFSFHLGIEPMTFMLIWGLLNRWELCGRVKISPEIRVLDESRTPRWLISYKFHCTEWIYTLINTDTFVQNYKMGIVQWHSLYLGGMRPWVQSPTLQLKINENYKSTFRPGLYGRV